MKEQTYSKEVQYQLIRIDLINKEIGFLMNGVQKSIKISSIPNKIQHIQNKNIFESRFAPYSEGQMQLFLEFDQATD